MAREIELKIRLENPQVFLNRLEVKAHPEANYHKVDTYFRGAEGSFRLREAEGKAVVCRKEKTLSAGIEVNRETEFGVDDPDAFRAFAKSLGYRLWYRKEKRGQAWRLGEVLIEVGTVSDLGWFAELELILEEARDSHAVERARRSLWAALDALEVPRDQVEPKTYSELLGHRVK